MGKFLTNPEDISKGITKTILSSEIRQEAYIVGKGAAIQQHQTEGRGFESRRSKFFRVENFHDFPAKIESSQFNCGTAYKNNELRWRLCLNWDDVISVDIPDELLQGSPEELSDS